MLTVMIEFNKNFIKNENPIQKKSFKDTTSYIEFCRKNFDKIESINGHLTFGMKQDHFWLMDIISQ